MTMKGALIAASVAGFFASANAPASAADKEGEQIMCSGINSCKGTGACAGGGHGCAGKNGCKGHGLSKTTKDDCKAKGGKEVKPAKDSKDKK